MNRFPICLAFTLREEGGWEDNPHDSGGPTNQGITLPVLSEHLKRKCTAADLKAMSPAVRDAIYLLDYWNKVAEHDMPPGVDLMLFDFGVTAGPETSAILLQEIVGAEPDGDIGPRTLDAVRSMRPNILIGALWARQLRHYRALPCYPIFGDGWEARTDRRKEAAFAALASSYPVTPQPVPPLTADDLNAAEIRSLT